jgi:hypothetical protein
VFDSASILICFLSVFPVQVIAGERKEGCPIQKGPPQHAQLQVLEPPALRQELTAGGAAFNPPTWSGRQAAGVMARWKTCTSLDTCLACDVKQCDDLVNRGDMKGNVMLHWETDAVCLKDEPSEVAKCAQEVGAVAMIFISSNRMIVTLPPSSLCLPPSWPVFSIASFNIPTDSKAAKSWRDHCQCADANPNDRSRCIDNISRNPVLKLKLPSSDANLALPHLDTGLSMYSPVQDEQDLPEVKPKSKSLPAWAIALIVGVVLLINAGFLAWRIRRKRERRRLFVLAALDQGTQFNLGDMSGIEMETFSSLTAPLSSLQEGEPTAPSLPGDGQTPREGQTPRTATDSIDNELMGGIGGNRTTGMFSQFHVKVFYAPRVARMC